MSPALPASPVSPNTTQNRENDDTPQPHPTNWSHEYERRISIQSTTSLPSPSTVAARAYYLESTTPIGLKGNAMQRRRSLFEVQQIPRRHSAVARSEDLAGCVAALKVLSSGARHGDDGVPASSGVKLDEAGDAEIRGSEKHDIDKTAPGSLDATREPLTDILRPAPFQFIHSRLRQWGYAFLGNRVTADAFINPVNLRRPSLELVKEEEGRDSKLVTIRARVVPKSKERKPVLIQKDFDIEGLRESIEQNTKNFLRRTSRNRRFSMRHTLNQVSQRASTGLLRVTATSASVPIRKFPPIHLPPARPLTAQILSMRCIIYPSLRH